LENGKNGNPGQRALKLTTKSTDSKYLLEYFLFSFYLCPPSKARCLLAKVSGNGQIEIFKKMSVKIRLQRMGRKKNPFYQIVVADSRSPRDGRYIERLGTYNPMTKPATIDIDREKALDWVMKGAQPTDTARAILRYKGIYYKKHLLRGVSKGSMTIEEAQVKHQQWVDQKEAQIAARVAQTAAEKAAFHAAVNGVAPPKVVAPAPAPAPEPVAPEAPAEAAQEESPAEE
jgi:small subunit ribosomal protein S16